MVAAERASWQNWRILTMLSLVFMAGALAGGLAMRSGLHTALHRSVAGWKQSQQLSFDRLKAELNLSSEQAEQLRSILDDMAKYNEDLQGQIENVRAQIQDVRATGRNRIEQILNPTQRERFEKISSELPLH